MKPENPLRTGRAFTVCARASTVSQPRCRRLESSSNQRVGERGAEADLEPRTLAHAGVGLLRSPAPASLPCAGSAPVRPAGDRGNAVGIAPVGAARAYLQIDVTHSCRPGALMASGMRILRRAKCSRFQQPAITSPACWRSVVSGDRASRSHHLPLARTAATSLAVIGLPWLSQALRS